MFVVRWGLVGIAATLFMDAFGAIGRAIGYTAGVPPGLVAKWLAEALSGRPFGPDIRTVAGAGLPLPLALLVHYLIGVLFALGLGSIVELSGVRALPWPAAIIYGLATTAFAAFVMFPGMGFGWLGAQGPAEWMLLRTSLFNHFCYGVGLSIGVVLLLPRLSR